MVISQKPAYVYISSSTHIPSCTIIASSFKSIPFPLSHKLYFAYFMHNIIRNYLATGFGKNKANKKKVVANVLGFEPLQN